MNQRILIFHIRMTSHRMETTFKEKNPHISLRVDYILSKQRYSDETEVIRIFSWLIIRFPV
jgi:hypothetical protein